VTQDDWAERLIKVVAEQIKTYRDRRGISAQRLADICKDDFGLPITRGVITNLETGRRPTLNIHELLVLAKVLQVAPIQLLFPIGHSDEVEILPGQVVNTWDAVQWFTGDAPLIRRNDEGNQLPLDSEDLAALHRGDSAVPLFREHDRQINQRHAALLSAVAARRAAAKAQSDGQREIQTMRAESEERQVRDIERSLRESRDYMRGQGIAPPVLPADLAHLDEKGTPS